MVDASVIRERFAAVGHGLNERSRRLLVAAEAKTAGYGGTAKNGGSDYRPEGCPDQVNVHDFVTGVPLSARYLEMEQDRAPAVLPHHPDLAR
jgi:hypothetical protein